MQPDIDYLTLELLRKLSLRLGFSPLWLLLIRTQQVKFKPLLLRSSLSINWRLFFKGVKSYLTAPKYFKLIRSLDDLAWMSSLFIVEKYNSIWYDMMVSYYYCCSATRTNSFLSLCILKSQTSGTYGIIGKALLEHPENALTSLADLEDMVALKNKVFAQVTLFF